MRAPEACPLCGTELPPGARFCPSCGQPQRDAQATEERRLVTVLFADIEGFTALSEDLDPESVKELLDLCFDRLVPVIGAYGGHVDKIIGDELMAVFGAPTAFEDDAERAVRASLELHEALAEVAPNLRLRVGVNTGEVLAGAVGPAAGYTVTGDVVNTAHRLAGVAEPGEVLVGARTMAATPAIGYRSRGTFDLKGKQEPVEGWVAEGPVAATAGRAPTGNAATPLIGRDDEIRSLLEQVAEAVDQRRSAVSLLVGEAGVGKTRLASEVSVALTTKPALEQVLWASCPSYAVDADLAPLTELIRAGLGVPATIDRDQQRAVLSQRLDGLGLGTRPALEQRLLDLLGLGTPATGPVEIDQRSGHVGPTDQHLAAVGSVLGALAEDRGLVVIVDDLHWAGRRLVRFLTQLADWYTDRPIFVLGLARDDLLERHPTQFTARNCRVRSLEPLDADATASLACAVLDSLGPTGSPIGPETLDQLARASGGSPLLVEQLIRFLVESERLVNVDGRWVWDRDQADEQTPIPDGLRSLIGARLDALPADERALITEAAIGGRRFWLAALAELGPWTRPEVNELVTRLTRRGLVAPNGDGREGDHQFRHALTRDVAYASVPLAERAERHAAFARWLERRSADRDDAPFGLLAHHYERAVALSRAVGHPDSDLVEPAFAALVRAARDDARREGLRRSDRWYRRARDVGTGDDDLLIDVVAEHGSVLLEIGRHEDAAQAFEELHRRAGQARPPMAALAIAHLGAVARLQGEVDQARERFDIAVDAWRELGDLQGVADTYRLQGWAEFTSGRPRAAMARLEHAAAIEERLEEPVRRSETLRYLGWCELLDGRLAKATKHLTEAADLAGESDEPGAAGWCLGLLGQAFLRQGRAGQALETAAALREYAAQESNPWGEWTCATLEAAALVALGRAEDGRVLAEQALERFAELDSAWELGLARLVAGQAARELGDYTGARAILSSAVDARRVAGVPTEDALALVELARVDLDTGALDDADRRARSALMLARAGIGDDESAIRALLVLASVATKRDDAQSAELFLEDAIADRAVEDRSEGWLLAALRLATRRLERGDVDGARELVDQAADPAVDAAAVAVLRERLLANLADMTTDAPAHGPSGEPEKLGQGPSDKAQ